MVDTPSLEELTSLRTELTRWMPDVCTITRVNRADDPYGGEEDTDTPFLAGVPCSIESGAGQEQLALILDRVRGVQIYTITFPALTDVRVNDKLIITSQGNLQLRVQAVMDPESWELDRRAIASEEGGAPSV